MPAILALLVATVPVILRPGASEIASDQLGDAIQTVRLMRADSEIGRFRYEWHVVPNDGLLLVTSGEVRSKSFVDSSLVKRHGLAPVREMAQFGGHVDHWTYDGPHVTFTRDKTVEHTYDGPVFNFQELDDLLRSLPLRQNYERILPLYSEGDDSLEMDTVRIMSRDASGRWTLRFADPAIVATYEVDERTRRIVRHEYVSRKTGALMRYLGTPETSTSSAPPG
jgi:hypothetical protein